MADTDTLSEAHQKSRNWIRRLGVGDDSGDAHDERPASVPDRSRCGVDAMHSIVGVADMAGNFCIGARRPEQGLRHEQGSMARASRRYAFQVFVISDLRMRM